MSRAAASSLSLNCDTARADLVHSLSVYEPFATQDTHARELMLEVLASKPDCFERSAMPGHFTGSAWIIDAQRSSVLLHHHRKLDRWIQLGGHADGEVRLNLVAEREAREESGISSLVVDSRQIFDVDVHRVPAYGPTPAHMHYDVRYLVTVEQRFEPGCSEESFGVQWVPIADVGQLTSEQSVLRMVERTLLRSPIGLLEDQS